MNNKEVADAFRKLANDALAVAIATENDDPMAIAMSLIDFKFSQMDATKKMFILSKERIEKDENNA